VADWPGPDELKQVLDVTSEDWNDTLDRVLSSAIARVKGDVGSWDDDVDEPTDNLAQAALRMAELMALRPEAAAQAATDPTYVRLLKGSRQRFGFA
jgi:hypothetical protein